MTLFADLHLNPQKLAGMIDHTLLSPEATPVQVIQLCEEARQYGFVSVCVNPTHVPLCADQVNGTPVKVCTVIGFPLGATTPEVKTFEAYENIRQGATELDMVINIGALKAGDRERVKHDIQGVVLAGRAHKTLVKVIIETCLLTDAEKITACLIAKEAGAAFVKTSTGFSTSGATVADINLIRRAIGPEMGVMASGGIRSLENTLRMIHAGANRIGTGSGVKIIQAAVEEAQNRE